MSGWRWPAIGLFRRTGGMSCGRVAGWRIAAGRVAQLVARWVAGRVARLVARWGGQGGPLGGATGIYSHFAGHFQH